MSDELTADVIRQGIEVLRKNNVPPNEDGFYVLKMQPSWVDAFAIDQDERLTYRDKVNAMERINYELRRSRIKVVYRSAYEWILDARGLPPPQGALPWRTTAGWDANGSPVEEYP